MITYKTTECPICKRKIKNCNFQKHYQSCANPNSKMNIKLNSSHKVKHNDLFCEFCGKECKNRMSLAQHEVRCPQNDNRKDFRKLTDYVEEHRKGKSKETCEDIKKQSDTLKRLYKSGILVSVTKGKKGTFTGKHHTKEQIDKMMASYKRFCINHKRRFKFGTYKGIKCDSSWELAFVIYNIEHNIHIERNIKSFPYIINQKTRYFYPDFIINGEYYEIKGFKDETVEQKIKQFPQNKTIYLIDENLIEKYVSYCTNKYGTDFAKMYDRSFPSWLDGEDQYLKRS